ncbi:MAG: reverse transcriptase/maturase family protein [bacterium]|nr:reverse transcriptase/maturase family protein [bacterium]MDZ4225675.1 reverse transcriptase/maturase family protein [Candidatus Andersenbacteria bacterium]
MFFSQVTQFANLVQAWKLASRGKRDRLPVARFSAEMDERLVEIKTALENGTWQPGLHRQFFVYDPKFRSIAAPPFADRVVHHAICAVIEPLFERRFIFDSYACRMDKGAHVAIRRLQKFLRKKHTAYALKCDISKFFASINQIVLRRIIGQTVHDPRLLKILDLIIAGYSPGIPIGNLTSQLFANIYLDQLDHFIKEELRIKYYLRYMDDFVILGKNKADLTKTLTVIRTFLTDTLKLTLHPRKVRLFPTRLGVDFVGYVVFPDHILLRPKNVRRFMKKLRKQQKGLLLGKITQKEFEESVRSWVAHASHADTFGLRRKLFASANLPAFSPVPSSAPPSAKTVRGKKTSTHRPPAPLPAKPKDPHPPDVTPPTVQLALFGYWPGSPAPKTLKRKSPTADQAQTAGISEKC